MTDWQQVNVRVRESEYEDWKEYAESQYGGMTDLVRTAVRREIDDHYAGESGGSGEMVQEVAEAIDSLENTVKDMDRRLTVVRESVESSGPDYSFKAAVRETVPEDGGLTAGQIAARLDVRESDVAKVLEELEYEEEVRQTPEGESDKQAWTAFEVV